jgi:putative intracellular protease/amidase
VSLTGKRIAVLVAEGVEELEYFVPLMRLREERADVFGAGLDLHTIKGKHGLEITPTVKVDTLKAADLSGLVIPGGWAPDKLRRSAAVTTREADRDHLPRRSCRYFRRDRERQKRDGVARNQGRSRKRRR